MNGPRIGSLFSGYAGLEMGVQAVLGGTVAWHSEIDPGACKILAHRYPDVPNIGDITAVDWSAVEPVDVLTAGYPCQPFSGAGKRQGINDVRHLWPYAAEAVGNLRPEWVVLENVRGHLTLGFDQVLRDLDLLHYEARWIVLRAADIGAPHGRARIFILGRNRGLELRGGTDRRGGLYRDRRGGRVDAAPAEGRHDGQGDAEPGRDASGVRREAGRGPSSRGADEGVARMAAERTESCGSDRAVAAEAADEGRAGVDRAGVSADGGRSSATVESFGGLGRRDAPSGADLPSPHPRGESQGPRPGTADPAARSTAGGSAVRGMVGAGRGSLRPGGVHGTLSDIGDDDRGAHLSAICGATCLCDAQPAQDAHGAARGERWLAAPGQAEGGRARAHAGGRDRASAADADRDGVWVEPVAEPGGDGAAESELSGSEPCPTCGCAVFIHDFGGFCAGPCGGSCTDPEWGRPALAHTDNPADDRQRARTEPRRGSATTPDPDGNGRGGEPRASSRRNAVRPDQRDDLDRRDRGIDLSGDNPEGRPGEVLRDVRRPHGAEPLQHGTPRDSDALPEPAELLAELWEHEARSGQGYAPLAGQAPPEGGVRDMHDDAGSARPSRRPEPHEQRPGESPDPVLVVSSQAALAGGPRETDGSSAQGAGDCGCSLWGQYAPAVHRWEMALGRIAPPPTEPGGLGMARIRDFADQHHIDGYTAREMLRAGKWGARLSARAVEWMQGLPAGWVTDVPGLSRNEQLKALGNGVVPQQAAQALRLLLPDVLERAA